MKRNLFSLIRAAFVSKEVKNTQLIQAAEKGDLQIVQTALADGAEVNAKAYGSAALYMAAWYGRTDVVKLLLENGADVNIKSNSDKTALWIASDNGHIEVVKLLLDKGADVNVNRTDGVTTLMMAAQNGHTEIIKLLLENGADANARANNGFTVLKVAKMKGRADIIQLLEKADAKDAEATEAEVSNGQLIQAAKDGNLPAVQTLLADGANVNAKNIVGATALIMAADKGHIEVVKLLLEKGAEVNAKGTDGTTALRMAVYHVHIKVVELLLEKGADVNVNRTDDGQIALLMALEYGRMDIVKFLQEGQGGLFYPGGQRAFSPAQEFIAKESHSTAGRSAQSDEQNQRQTSTPESHTKAMKDKWKEKASQWWDSCGRDSCYCDDNNCLVDGENRGQSKVLRRGDGYIPPDSSRIYCEECADRRLHLADVRKDQERTNAVTGKTFSMRIESVFASGAGVMVAGSPVGASPAVGGEVEVISSNDTQKARIKDATSMGNRVAYVLEGIGSDKVKQGDILQA